MKYELSNEISNELKWIIKTIKQATFLGSQLQKKHPDLLQVGLELEEEVVGLRRRGQAGRGVCESTLFRKKGGLKHVDVDLLGCCEPNWLSSIIAPHLSHIEHSGAVLGPMPYVGGSACPLYSRTTNCLYEKSWEANLIVFGLRQKVLMGGFQKRPHIPNTRDTTKGSPDHCNGHSSFQDHPDT